MYVAIKDEHGEITLRGPGLPGYGSGFQRRLAFESDVLVALQEAFEAGRRAKAREIREALDVPQRY